jgi:DNA-binding MarR family transcriptional regulator
MASNDELADDLGWDINRVTGRTNELRKKGLVAIGGTKRSKRTGKTVQWMEAVT